MKNFVRYLLNFIFYTIPFHRKIIKLFNFKFIFNTIKLNFKLYSNLNTLNIQNFILYLVIFFKDKCTNLFLFKIKIILLKNKYIKLHI